METRSRVLFRRAGLPRVAAPLGSPAEHRRGAHVHPQTVSGRISRLKDLLADDLEDPRVRSELLVLLIADTGEIMGATRPGQ